METNRYNNTRIYKLYDTVYGYFYIGSTCGTLSKRLYGHKHEAKVHLERKVYKCFNEIGWENVKIVLLEEHYLDNREQQMREEDRVIQMHVQDEKCLNSIRPWISISDKHERKLEHRRIYREKHHSDILEKGKQYYNANKEIINAKHKIYRDNTKEQQHQRYEIYKEKFPEKIFGKYICSCGSENYLTHKARHEKSKKHQAWLHDQKQTAETI